jgi:hypothetical protein
MINSNPVCITDIDGAVVHLKQIEVTKSHKTLGTYKCLCGHEDEHLSILKEKNKEFVRKAWTGQFTRRIARRAFNSNYISSMLYSLVTTTIEEKDIDEVQQKATTTFIRLQGYDMSYPRAVIYGPKKMGGVGILKLSVEGNCNKIESIITHMNGNTKLGGEFLINLNWLQIHGGKSCTIINSLQKFNYIQNNWFFPIKEFLNKTQSTLVIKEIWKPKIHRVNDKIIMDHLPSEIMTKTQQIQFNNWRMFLQVTNISDLATLDGKKNSVGVFR